MTVHVERDRPLWWVLGFLTWMGFAVMAVAGGIFRVLLLEPRLGTVPANLVETLGLAILLGIVMWFVMPWLVPGLDSRDLWRMGLYWLTLTVVFEFLFGHYVDGASWSTLLSNYDISAGRLWVLIPLLMGAGPPLVGRLRRRAVTWQTTTRAR